MTKTEFNRSLKIKLSGLPDEDIGTAVEYYNEMIDDLTDNGMTEEDAVSSLGSIEQIADEILSDVSLSKLIKRRITPPHPLRIWEIVLLVLGSPIWLSVGIAAMAVILSVYIVLWTVVVCFYAVSLSFAASALLGIGVCVIFICRGNIASGVFIGGCGIICAGFAPLMFLASNKIMKLAVIAGKKILIGIKLCFAKRGDTQ